MGPDAHPLRWVKINRGHYRADAVRFGQFAIREVRARRWIAQHRHGHMFGTVECSTEYYARCESARMLIHQIRFSPFTLRERAIASIRDRGSSTSLLYALAILEDRYPDTLHIDSTTHNRSILEATRTMVNIRQGRHPALPAHIRALVEDALLSPRMLPILIDACEDDTALSHLAAVARFCLDFSRKFD